MGEVGGAGGEERRGGKATCKCCLEKVESECSAHSAGQAALPCCDLIELFLGASH